MTVTKEQAQMLATLACAARPHGARRWDPAGVVAAIRHVADHRLVDVAHAVLRAADTPDLETPGAIANTASSAWRPVDAGAQPAATERPRRTRENTCGICGKLQTDCEANPWAEHEFEPLTTTHAGRRPNQLEESA